MVTVLVMTSEIWDRLIAKRGPHLVVHLVTPGGGHPSPTPCPHGQLGFCFDELSIDEKSVFCVLHGYAYGWAINDHGVNEDVAERFAGWFADMNYDEIVPLAGVTTIHAQFHVWAECSAQLN